MSNDRWDRYFLEIAVASAMMSKDPSTGVGAVIVGREQEVLATGFNGFPRGVLDTDDRLLQRDVKLELVVHAELNAILSAARNGVQLRGSTLYVVCLDKVANTLWGTLPCIRCAVEIIQAGISEVVYGVSNHQPKKSWDMFNKTDQIFSEACVSWRTIKI